MATNKEMVLPIAKINDPNFEYIDAEHTDIAKTWRRLGWTPPTEYRTDYNFGKQEKGA